MKKHTYIAISVLASLMIALPGCGGQVQIGSALQSVGTAKLPTIEEGVVVVPEAVQSGNTASAVQATKPTTQTPTANTGSAGGNAAASTPSGGNAASTTSAPSAPAHTHNWVAQTTPKYVVDVPAQSKIVCSCGAVFSSQTAKADWMAHSKAEGRYENHSYSAQGAAEQGHYETVTTGYTCSCGVILPILRRH